MKKTIYCFIFFAIIHSQPEIGAQEPDSANQHHLTTISLMTVKNLWFQTTNPASADYIREDRLGRVDLNYNTERGDYLQVSEPSKIYSSTFESEGYTRKNKITFYGKADYHITQNSKLRWNDVLLVSPLNPYTLADSIGGNYDTETFNIKGGIASASASENLRWGILLNYKGGSSADQADPRPLNRASRFSITPGAIYRLNKWDIGIDLNAEYYHENIDITNVNTYQTPHLFLFMGLGLYKPSTDLEYTRNYNGWTTAGNIQAILHKDALENLIQAGYKRISETARDGDTNNYFKAGDYNAGTLSFNNILKLFTTSSINLFSLAASYYSSEGTWYDQKQLNGANGTKYWQIYNQSIRFKQDITDITLSYQLIKEHHNLKKTTLGTLVNFINDNSFYYPDTYFLKASNLIIEFFGDKTFTWNSGWQLKLGLKSGYKHNLSGESYTKGIELEKAITLPNFYYKTAQAAYFNWNIELGKPAIMKGRKLFPFLEIKSGYYRILSVPEYYANAYRLTSTIKLGLIF